MKRTRRTAEDWRQILEVQKARGLTNLAAAAEFGVSVGSLGNWRRRLAGESPVETGSMVEVTSLVASGAVLKIHLANGIRLDAPLTWPMEHLGRVAKVLGSL